MAEDEDPGLQVIRQPSVVISFLQDLEKHFFELVSYGNVPDVRQFLEEHPDFNINAIDFQGVTALHIAVHDRNLPMVEYLLGHPEIDPGDTHLHAIRDNEIKITAVILNKLNELSMGLEYAGVTMSTDFPDETTPLAVAAQYGHFEMITYLRNRQHSLPKPHPPSCICEDCKSDREKYDLLALEKLRLFGYRAFSNPAYICQTVDDPILEAFNLSYELKQAASFDREFYYEYKELAKNITQFATDLIGCARTIDEVECILKQSTGFAHSSKFLYPRLLFALHNAQRTFVAHPNVQQLITSKWLDGWIEWKIMHPFMKSVTLVWRIVMLPVILVVFMVAPNSRWSKSWQSPVNKFISSTASYLVFLMFLFIQSNMDKTEQLRGPPRTGYVWILIIYVMSYSWALIRLFVIHGPRRFFSGLWYWFEMIMILMFIATFICWIIAAIDVRVNGQLELERKYWNVRDPTLIAEGIFCLATIMAFLKLLYICQLNYDLGPLQISLGKMIGDVVKFIALFTIIILAFTVGTCKLYQYYDGMVRTDDESKIKTEQVSSFVNFWASLKTFFWALFCMSPIESADVIIENLPGETDSETIINHHAFTEIIGYISFAGFTVISVIVILNMLIACMSNTMAKVTENVIVEWTFGRTVAHVDFMLTAALPPPFNIIPTFVGIQPVVEYIKIFLHPPPDKRARWDFSHCFYIESLEEDKDRQFSFVMSSLVQRYFRQKDKQVEENEIDRLTKEILELRTVLRDALNSD